MYSLLWKILLSRQGRWQFIIAAAGFGLGLLILLISVQFYSALNKVLAEQQRKEDQSSFLIINKEVSLLNTFNKSVSGFKDEEIDTLLQQNFILSAGSFLTNTYGISANL